MLVKEYRICMPLTTEEVNAVRVEQLACGHVGRVGLGSFGGLLHNLSPGCAAHVAAALRFQPSTTDVAA